MTAFATPSPRLIPAGEKPDAFTGLALAPNEGAPRRVHMLSVYRLPEALAWLREKSGREWTESLLFDVAVNGGIRLHAAPPITAMVTVQRFGAGAGLVEIHRLPTGPLATLFPWQVAQLWISGETSTSHPLDFDLIDGEYRFFTEPVHVTADRVRIRAESLARILGAIKPAVPHTTANAALWSAKKPKRNSGYSYPLYLLLKDFSQQGKKIPTPRDVLACWTGGGKPSELIEVMTDGLKYETSAGGVKVADLDAIRKAISRMTDV